MYAQSQVSCTECGGRGQVIKKRCPHCQGNKVVDHTAHYTLEITPGMPEGHEVVFEGEGDESPDWEPGNVVLRVRSKKERGGFKRKQTSLYWKETISVDEVCQFWACSGSCSYTIIGSSWLQAQPHTLRRAYSRDRA